MRRSKDDLEGRILKWFIVAAYTLVVLVIVVLVGAIIYTVVSQLGIVRPLVVIGAFVALVYLVRQVVDRNGWLDDI